MLNVIQTDKCLKSYGLEKLMNQEVELSYCFEHGGRTCCNNNDVLIERNKMAVVHKFSDPKVSDRCFAVTSRVLCTKCDADVSTGLSSGALCLNFCDEWFISCLYDYLDPYID